MSIAAIIAIILIDVLASAVVIGYAVCRTIHESERANQLGYECDCARAEAELLAMELDAERQKNQRLEQHVETLERDQRW